MLKVRIKNYKLFVECVGVVRKQAFLLSYFGKNDLPRKSFPKAGGFMGKKMYAYVNPGMLVWARSETPYKTAAEVEAAHPEIKADRLAAWELPFAAFYLSEDSSSNTWICTHFWIA